MWFQIVTHMVRLRKREILVLDEPEINLHPEKQNDLIGLLREYHQGSVIIATHSIELMNNVEVSHIIHVQKRQRTPVLKAAADRKALEIIRTRVGSNFNLVASQFEAVSLVLFTEDRADYLILEKLAEAIGVAVRTYNVPLHGFSEYRKAIFFKEAYEHLIGEKGTRFAVVLDRDYYPRSYLTRVGRDLESAAIALHLTPGKEIENLFLDPEVIRRIIGPATLEQWQGEWDNLCDAEYPEVIGSATKLYREFSEGRIDLKDITKAVLADFGTMWADPAMRHRVVPGKTFLGRLREFYRARHGANLSNSRLHEALVAAKSDAVCQWVEGIFSGPEGSGR